MTITKADREAAARILSICDRHYSAALVRNGRGDDDPVLEELVAHREAERDKAFEEAARLPWDAAKLEPQEGESPGQWMVRCYRNAIRERKGS